MGDQMQHDAASDAWNCLRPGCDLTADEHDLEMVMEHTYDLQEGAADGLVDRIADRLGIEPGEDHVASPQERITRFDKYNILVDGVKIFATPEQEEKIRLLNDQQLDNLKKINGG